MTVRSSSLFCFFFFLSFSFFLLVALCIWPLPALSQPYQVQLVVGLLWQLAQLAEEDGFGGLGAAAKDVEPPQPVSCQQAGVDVDDAADVLRGRVAQGVADPPAGTAAMEKW